MVDGIGPIPPLWVTQHSLVHLHKLYNTAARALCAILAQC